MPFTPSHAVVALPFVRTRLVPAGIAVGAMTPDLPLFVRGMVPDYAMTHDLRWLPLTTLVAFVLLVIWRCVLRPAVRELAPRPVAERLPGEWDAGASASLREIVRGGIPAIVWLVLSLALGVATHIAWDLLTHEGRAGVQLFPVLDEQWGPLPGVKWLQHGSSVLGLAVLALVGAVWLARRTPVAVARVLPDAIRILWWLSLPLALVVSSAIALVTAGGFDADFTPTHLIYGVLTKVATVWAATTVALAVVVQIRRRP